MRPKRDMDLVRELLLRLEAWQMEMGDVFVIPPDDAALAVAGHDPAEIEYHLSLLRAEGFLDCPGSQPMLGITFAGLTWKGHEFLDDIRDPGVWQKTKERTKGVASVGVGFLWEIAKAEVRAKLGLP